MISRMSIFWRSLAGLRGRSLAVVALIVVPVVALMLSGILAVGSDETLVKRLYGHAVLPTVALKAVSDGYTRAGLLVAGQVRNGDLAWGDGETAVRRLRDGLRPAWAAYRSQVGSQAEQPLIQEAEARMADANVALDELADILAGQDAAGLASYTGQLMYASINPLLSVLARLADQQELAGTKLYAASKNAIYVQEVVLWAIIAIVGFAVVVAVVAIRRCVVAPLLALNAALAVDGPEPEPGPMDALIRALARFPDNARRATRLAAELAEAREQAEEATGIKSSLLAVIHEEIRAPVQEVVLTAERLDQTDLTGDQRRLSLAIRRSAAMLAIVIDDILDIPAPEPHPPAGEPSPVLVEAGQDQVALPPNPELAPSRAPRVEAAVTTVEMPHPEGAADADVHGEDGRTSDRPEGEGPVVEPTPEAPTPEAPTPKDPEIEEAVWVPPSEDQARAVGAAVLVAEDDAADQLTIRFLLTRLGYVNRVVGDGVEALAQLEETGYGLLLTDCEMPEMDGFGLTAAIRAAEASGRARLPIVALTADDRVETHRHCLDAGMDLSLSKPIDRSALARTLETLLPQALGLRQTPDAVPEPVGFEIDPETLDVERFRESFGSFGAEARLFLVSVVDHVPALLDAIHRAFDRNDRAAEARTVHALTVAAASIGAIRLGRLAADIQKCLDNGNGYEARLMASLLRRTHEELAKATIVLR